MTSDFVGREAVAARLAALLTGGARLVTVLGPAGVGKTRLTHEVTEGLRRAGRRVVRCDLEAVLEADGVLPALVRAAQVRLTGAEALAPLAEGLARRGPAILFVDNAEGVAEALSELLDGLLRLAPALTVVVTSQVRLPSEHAVALDLEPLDADAARALFVRTARRVAPEVALGDARVDAVVAAFAGLPLALELAATRLRYRPLEALPDLPLDALFRGDRSAPPRRRSLTAALRGSWSLLSPEARAAAGTLAACPGGFAIEDGVALLGGGAAEGELDVLRDHSLVWTGADAHGPRHGLFDAFRRFARDETPEAERRAHERAHAVHYEAEGRRRRDDFHRSDPAGARRWLEREQDNLRSAILRMREAEPGLAADLAAAMGPRLISEGPAEVHRGWLQAAVGDAERALGPGRDARIARAATDLAFHHVVRGQFTEAFAWTKRATDHAPADTPVGVEAWVMVGHLHTRTGTPDGPDLAALQARAEAAGWIVEVSMARVQRLLRVQVADPEAGVAAAREHARWARSHALVRAGLLARSLEGQALLRLGRSAEALGPLEAARDGFAALGEPVYAGLAHADVAAAWRAQGDLHRALEETEAGLAEARAAGDDAGASKLWQEHLELRMALGDADGARAALDEARRAVTAVELPEMQARWRALVSALAAPERPPVLVARSGEAFLRDGERVDLTRRRAVRHILARLAEAAVAGEPPLLWEELYEAAWVDGDADDPGARGRLYTAVWTLRSLGLDGRLVTTGDGYRLDGVRVVDGLPSP